MPDTDQRLREIEERLAKATDGPWENCRGFVRSTARGSTLQSEDKSVTITTSTLWVAECRDGEAFYNPDGNADFIAASRQDVPYLLSRLRASEQRVERMRRALEVVRDIAAPDGRAFTGHYGEMVRRGKRLQSAFTEARAALTDTGGKEG